MIHNYTKFIILVITLILVQNFDLAQKRLQKIKTPTETTILAQLNSLPNGYWFLIRNVQSKMCISWGKDRILRQVLCNMENESQWWKITKNQQKNEGWVRISNTNNEFLDNKASTTKGTEYMIWTENGSTSQSFYAEMKSSGFSLQSEQGKLCVAPSGLNDQSLVSQFRCCGTGQTQWTFEKVTPRKPTPGPNYREKPVPVPNPHIPLDTLVTIRVKKTGKCLTAHGFLGEFKFAKCNHNNKDQKFMVLKNGEFYRVFNPDNLAFDLKGSGKQNQNKYWLYQVNGTPAQNWSFVPTTGKFFKVVSQASNKCLDNPVNTETLLQWDCHGLDHQQFSFKRIKATPTTVKPNKPNSQLKLLNII